MDYATNCATCNAVLKGRCRKFCGPPCKDRARNQARTGKRGPRRKAPLRVIGVDGESIDGRYILLGAADDDGWSDYVENPEGLSTVDCLRFLTSLPKGKVWGFAFGYDVNMMLGDVPLGVITRLYENGHVYWRTFRIAYVAGKKLTVTRYAHSGKGAKKIGSVTVWDMFTWIQSSFVNWIESWELAPEREIARIRSMKAQRSTFTSKQRRAIRTYCLSECEYLAAGGRRLLELIAAAGVTVSTYYSPATISKALMRDHDVAGFRDTGPKHLLRAFDEAYMGGRAEVSEVGPMEGPFWQYDIRSAYPAAAIGMPCLAHGAWVQTSEVEPWSIVRVSWRPFKGKPSPTWGPLPVRPRTGSLRWPTHGTGWYWGVEVLAAKRHAHIDVKDCWTFRPGCHHRPFSYLEDLYRERRRRKDAGDPSEFVLKLALNATYGALAEHPIKHQKEPPKYRCLPWAGWITAATRAKLLDALDDSVVLMATDSLMSKTPLDVPLGDALGEWEVKAYDRVWIAGTGIYYGQADGEWSITKTRGFEPGQLSREMFDDLWAAEGRVGRVRLFRTRFIGMGTALHRINGFYPPHLRLWRQFIQEPCDKSLDVAPRRRWASDDVHDGRSFAPTLMQHKALEAADRDRLARLKAEYDTVARRIAELEATIGEPANMRLGRQRQNAMRARKAMARVELERTMRTMVLLDQSITAAGREGSSVFDAGTDPQDNG